MSHYLLTLGIVAHACFWGAGASWLVLPRRWRRMAWIVMPATGLALQSAVVWFAALAGLHGTDAYARVSEVIPAVLLVLAFLRVRRAPQRAKRHRGAPCAVAAIALVAGYLLVSPLTVPGKGIYPSSLGSCDAADYAAGARVFQEFARDERVGFLDQPDVTVVGSSEYFFEFWLRLNHFTPSALIAHNASVFGVEAFRITAVIAPALLLLTLPLVWLLARVLVGIRGGWLAGVTILYAISPINAYAVHHIALGQILAAQGIALLTVVVALAYRTARSGGIRWGWLPLLAIALWLLAGSYNFIIVVCLAPAASWLVLQAIARSEMRAAASVGGTIAIAAWLCFMVFWNRFDGLAERFALFDEYNFGWRVPLLTPEAWIGLVRDEGLNPFSIVARSLLVVAVVFGWLAGAAFAERRRRFGSAIAAFSLVAPVAAGWLLLAMESRVRANASYDAYKLLAVFLPGIVAGLCCWTAAATRLRPGGRRVAWVALALLIGANLAVALRFRTAMSHPPLRLDRAVVELGKLETDGRVSSVNLVIDDFWSRLWANAFLLRKPQYFAIHTYEGRLNTELRGEWDLSDGAWRAAPVSADDFIPFNTRFHLVRTDAEGRIRLSAAHGWFPEERAGVERWRWSGGRAAIVLANPATAWVRADLRLRLRSFQERELEVRLDGKTLARLALDGSEQELELTNVIVPPGRSELVLIASGEPGSPGPADDRKLSFALLGFELKALAVGD